MSATLQKMSRRLNRRSWRRRMFWAAGLLLAGVAIWQAYAWWTRPVPTAAREIYRGVTYEGVALDGDTEGSGLAQLVTVDLTAPGIELYVTPLDPAAVAAGHQYQLAWGSDVATQNGLAILINGTLHLSHFKWLPLPGSWADSMETLIADGEISHVDPNSYLLWFDEQLRPTLEFNKPPADVALQQARWGIGGQGVALVNGHVSPYTNRAPDARTIIGVDPLARRLYLATFESASEHRAAEFLASRGAQDALLLDGGSSTMLYLGKHAAGVPGGLKQGGWRPVATFLGVRAESLLPTAERVVP